MKCSLPLLETGDLMTNGEERGYDVGMRANVLCDGVVGNSDG
jgi:hypothetical protein